jgi:hypothetical protein
MRCGQIDFPNELLQAIRDGRFVVFAGAGVSMGDPANLPSFWSLAEQIAQGSGLAPHEPLDHFLGQLYHRGIALHQRAADRLSRPDLMATPLHGHLLQLFPLPEQVRVVTTNFDLLFQRAAEDIWGSVPEVFCAPALPLGGNFHGIVHVHGALTAPQDIVLTDSDFGRAYLTEGWARRFLVDLFRHFIVLFVGYRHRDTVMHYLARALLEQEAGRRFVLVDDSTDGDLQFWRLLGIQPILFPKSHKSDYSELYNGVHQLAKHVRRGILDWQREITTLAESGPPMDEASVSLIEQGLKEVATTRFFVQAARAQEWIEWLEKRGVFDALFDGTTLSEQSNLLAQWLAKHYALQYPSELFLLIGRHSLRLNATFWWALAREVSREESPIDTDTYARWVSLLLATAPQNADAYALNWLAERGAKLGDFQSVLQIFAHMTAWRLEVKPSFSWDSDDLAERTAHVDIDTPVRTEHWHLQEVWQKFLRPHLDSLAAPLLSIVVAHLQQKYATHSLWQTANRE